MKLRICLLLLPLLVVALGAAQTPPPPPEPPMTPQAEERAEVSRGEIVTMREDIVIESGERADSVVCIGCSVILRGAAQDVVAIGGSVRIEGGSAADVAVIGGSLHLDGTILGDAAAIGGDLVMAPGASISGDAAAVGGALRRDPTATIGGEASSVAIPLLGSLPFGVALLVLLLFVLGAFNLVLAALCYPVAGRARVLTIAQSVQVRTGMTLLAGLGACVFVFVLLSLAGLMGPASLFIVPPLLLLTFIVLVLGYTGLSFWLGNRIAPNNHPFVLVLLGALLITIIQIIPFVGQVAMLFFVLLALGAVVMTGFGGRLDWLQRQLRPAAAPPPVAR